MWRLLRESFPDAHFRHQVPIRHYFADFASHQFKLVIEIDGGQHNDQVDAKRTLVIEQEGYRVIRFWNNDVLGSRDGVWSMIDAACRMVASRMETAKQTPQKSRKGRKDEPSGA